MLSEKATVVISQCLGVKPDEEVLIVTDGTISERIVQAFQTSCFNAGAKTHILQYKPERYVPMREFSRFAEASTRTTPEISRTLSSAICEADATILLTSDMTLTFAKAKGEALHKGRRIVASPYLSEETMLRLFPSSATEVIELDRRTENICSIFEQSTEAAILSRGGAKATLELGDYKARYHGGIVDSGSYQVLPAGQVTIVPNDNSFEGSVVIDRSIAGPEYKPLSDPIVLNIASGNVGEIKGTTEADNLERFLEELNDSAVYHVTELGVGTNPKCRFTGIAAPAEDTHKWGCVSIALGCDSHLGGKTKAKVHIDCTMRYPTLIMDDRTVVDHGKLVE
jgi:leucyl aminopeptidase (aminopeptidase T)